MNRRGVQRSEHTRGEYLALRIMGYTGTAKLPAQAFATCKKISTRTSPQVRKREKGCTSLLPPYATIARTSKLASEEWGRQTPPAF